LDASDGELLTFLLHQNGITVLAAARCVDERVELLPMMVYKLSTLLLMGALCSAVLSVPAGAQNDAPNEYQVKAAFLFNFAKFVDWPADTYPNAQWPFSICILGEDPFGAIFDSTLAGKSLGTHPVVLRRIKEVSEIHHCQIVFVSSSSTSKYAELSQSVRGAKILLVGESDGFATSGGAVEFIVEANHVRFAINPEAVQRAGLAVSSKLLMLARIVHDSNPVSAGKS
jgi:hypothetical protein